MGNRTILLIATILSLKSINGQNTVDTSARVLYLKCLKVIEDHVKSDKSNIEIEKISKIISFFTELTGIPSDADGTYLGQINPSEMDHTRWAMWYLFNKENIFIDKKTGHFIVHKKIPLPNF